MEQSERVLFIDDDAPVRTAFARSLRGRDFQIDLASGHHEAMTLVAQHTYAVVVSDYRMPEINGLELIEEVRGRQPDATYVLISGECDLDLALEAVNDHSVSNVVTKPWDIEELSTVLRRGVESHWERAGQRAVQKGMVTKAHQLQQQRVRLEEAMREAENFLSEVLLNTLELRGHETKAHCRRVASFSLEIANAFGLKGKVLTSIKQGALLHDVGKMGISDAILTKPGPLTSEEWSVMRDHVDMGARLLEGFPVLEGTRAIVSQHHERWDGSGYPLGLRGDQICVGARIFAVADTLDAILSDRPYRKGAPVSVAVEEIVRCSGSQFDPDVVAAFQRVPAARWAEILTEHPEKPRGTQRTAA